MNRYLFAILTLLLSYSGFRQTAPADMQTKALVTNVTLKSYYAAVDALKSMIEVNMNEIARLYRFDLTKEAIFRKGFEHQTHHRGQTAVYLRLKGMKPPFERLF